MPAPDAIAGRAVVARERVAGGDLNDAYHATLDDGRDAFVKTRADAQPGEYELEAEGLARLAAPGGLRTPAVLGVADDHLALEWIAPGRLDVAGEEELGRGLARTHASGPPRFGDDAPMRLGPLVLPNDPSDDWPSFYVRCRLAPLASRAGLSASGREAVERVCERIGDLAGPPEPPALVHGDLWSGNVLAGRDGRPWLIDPAVHGGHREVDLAMLALFGTPSPRTLAAYAEVAPLARGHEERTPLWQLHPLLVHAVLFGGGYAAAVERAARAAFR